MILYPAIDLRAGKAVRLEQGDFSRETIYSDDPVKIALDFADAGAQWIHVVDLDGARDGTGINRTQIKAMASAVSCSLQVGGGVRTRADVVELIESGANRVVVGTVAVETPDLVIELAQSYPNQIAVGLDARGSDVAVRGWIKRSGVDLVELTTRYDNTDVAALIVTEIGRDGMMMGPDVKQLGKVLAATSIPVIASGGVGSLDDVRALGKLRFGDRCLNGVIAGRAIYEKRFSVAEAIKECSI